MECDYSIFDSFVIFIGQKGNVTIEYEGGSELIKPGESILIPASMPEFNLIPKGTAELLEVYIV